MVRRLATLAAVLLAPLTAGAVAWAHELDHAPPTFAEPAGPLSSEINAGGEGAEWELVTSIPTGNPHSDIDFFTYQGDQYLSAGTLGVGPNAGGQNIVRLTKGGVVEPSYVAAHPSAACPGIFTSATGLQHDVEATPKGNAFQQQPNPFVDRRDVQLLVDSTDGSGRCHDNGAFGAGAPNGGLELIDVTDPSKPFEIALIRHIGNAHTVNVDPKRPHIAFDITQDGVSVCANGQRSNEFPLGCPETQRPDSTKPEQLDGFEVIDMSSCMNLPSTLTKEQKRERCRPEVYRYRYPEARIATSHAFPKNLQSCHETEIYPDDRLVCSSITSTVLFDMKGAFDDRGTPNDFTDDKPRGTPLPCAVKESSSPEAPLKTGAPIIDCENGVRDGKPQPLYVLDWMQIGSPSLEGVEWLGTVPHMGFATTTDIVNTKFDADVDILAAHESELTQSGDFVITSDERGGGTVPGGASCAPRVDNKRGNGGLHFFPTKNFTRATPLSTEQAQALWGKTADGGKAIYRAPTRTGPQGAFCTAHVFQQIPGQNRIFMGWYSQGTQVIDFTENPDGTLTFREAGYFIPENANTWVSHVFKAQRNQDGSFTYWGATGDGILPGTGRSAIEVYKVTLPPAPIPAGGPKPGTPELPLSAVRGVENERAPTCARTHAFERTAATPIRGRRGLRFAFARRGTQPVTVDLFRAARGSRIAQRRVARFARRARSFSWRGTGRRVTDGVYNARFTVRAPNGGADVRRVALVRRDGRWYERAPFYRRTPCALIESAKLSRPVFGSGRRVPLGISLRLNQAARVDIVVRRGGRVLRRFAARSERAGRTIRRTLAATRIPRGDVRIVIRARRTGQTATQVLLARRL